MARQEVTTDQSLSELVQQLSNQTAALVRKEIRLAQLELQEKGKRAGIGMGMFGGSGVVALYGLGALIAAAILGLATGVAAWLAALIVAVLLFVAAGGSAEGQGVGVRLEGSPSRRRRAGRGVRSSEGRR